MMSLQKKLKSLTIDDMTRGLVAHLSGISMGSSTKCQNIWCYYTSTMRGWLQYYYLYKWTDGIVIILRFPRIVTEHIETHQNKQNYLPVSSHLPPPLTTRRRYAQFSALLKRLASTKKLWKRMKWKKNYQIGNWMHLFFQMFLYTFWGQWFHCEIPIIFCSYSPDTIRQFFGFSQSHYLPWVVPNKH